MNIYTTGFVILNVVFRNGDAFSFDIMHKKPMIFTDLRNMTVEEAGTALTAFDMSKAQPAKEELLVAAQTVRNTIEKKLADDGSVRIEASFVNALLPETMECTLREYTLDVCAADCLEISTHAFPMEYEPDDYDSELVLAELMLEDLYDGEDK